MLKELIKSRGIKQKWLADQVGVTRLTISNWVNGKYIPKQEHVEKLAKVLNVDEQTIINAISQ